ncbi:alpha/beta fold hydrolase [Nonomuraea endophytica]|uniref:Pimeloyl-ACP methyl ester carboxylesterase n=1 Tax=Nonomuraea endophytica TaxID=714136 RepID=A0A7W8A6G2_9ACTN|nr:alpha/beta hydrolase [Nonomuraea endophytica]MBB5080460.1 pimeloyl-ACP methyl ester carboxylesterase [Nonomuraea endophytica]
MSGILVLHAGLDDGSMWRKPAELLAARYPVEVPVRLQYRPDRRAAATIEDEVAETLAAAERMGGQVLLVGHSSGGVVALEALRAGPFAGAVLYEPPVITGTTLGGDTTRRAQAAMARGKTAKAMRIFFTEVIKIPGWQASMGALAVALVPKLRALAPRQLDDLAAIDALGNRLGDYANIQAPVVLLGGDQSPAHLGERMDALERVLPHSTRVVMRGQGHTANHRAPDELARIILEHADRVLV